MESSSITVSRNSALQPVKTLGKGHAGFSRGAPTVEIQVKNAVPLDDFEFIANINEAEIVELTVFAGNSKARSKGCIISDNFSAAVDTESSYEFTFSGGPLEWE